MAAVATQAAPEEAPDLDLGKLVALWPAVADEVCKEREMIGSILRDARPTSLEADRLLVCFAPDAGFSKKKVETNRQLVQAAIRAITGSSLDIRFELSELEAETAQSHLSEEELLERLKQEFGAKEVFDDAPAPGGGQ
jgi:hypothetical protein